MPFRNCPFEPFKYFFPDKLFNFCNFNVKFIEDTKSEKINATICK